MGRARTVIDRAHVLAHRVAAQGLHRDAHGVDELAVLDLGVQEAMAQPAGYAFAARLPIGVDLGPTAVEVGPGADLALAWTLRGAPHVHRRGDLDALAGALWPMSEPDAAGRLNETGPSVERAGVAALAQFGLVVDAMRAVVTSSVEKGAASTAVTERLPEPLRRPCRGCATKHVSDSSMRVASLAAGVELEPGTAPPVLVHRSRPRRVASTDRGALTGLATAYLRLLGPARPAEVAAHLGCRRADLVEQGWPADLAEVEIDGRAAWLPADRLDALREPPEPHLVRLLGPFDPYLQARDRDLLVPDSAVHKALWPVLGRPGVLLVDGEVAGVWRTRATKRTLTVTVETFGAVAPSRWPDVEAEATRVAEVRGVADVAVRHL